MKSKSLEWFGVVTAIMYSMLVAFNIGVEFTGFLLLLVSAFSIGYWAYLGRHKGILFFSSFMQQQELLVWLDGIRLFLT